MPTRLRQQKHPFGSLRKDPHWSTKGLVGLWQFKPAGKLIDETANKNDGTITGATWVAEGLRFDGTDDEVAISLPSPLVAGGPITIVVAARQTTSDLEGLVNVQAAAGNPGQIGLIYLDTGNVVKWSREQSGARGQISNVIDTSIWHQYICTHAGGAVQGNIYIDGVLENSGVGISLSDFGANNIQIGAGLNATLDFTGEVAYCYVYDRVLSASESQALYINPDLPLQRQPLWLGKAPAVAGTTPKGPLTHPLYGPFAGPIAC